MRLHDEDMIGEDEQDQAVRRAVSRSEEKMPRDVRRQVRGRLMAQISPAPLPVGRRLVRPALALATALALTGGVSYAAAQAAPGDLLYPVKRSAAGVAASVRKVLGVPRPAPQPSAGSSGVNKPVVTPPVPPAEPTSAGPSARPSLPAVARPATSVETTAPGRSGSVPATNVPSNGSSRKPVSPGKSSGHGGSSRRNGPQREGTARETGRESSQSSLRVQMRRGSHQ